MNKIEDVRRRNLAALREQIGSVAELAERIGKSQSQVSQWLNASTHSSSGKPRTISSGSCREIEKAFKKPDGWMDVEHVDLEVVQSSEASDLRRMLSEASADIRLLSVYRLANDDERKLIDAAVRIVIEKMDIVGTLHNRK